MRRVAPWVAALAVGLGLATSGVDVAEARPARTAATNVAGVTVSFGDGRVVRRTVSFASGSISGIEALQGAGFDVQVYGYSGLGAAVCRIDGVGRAPDAACFSGGDGSYWAYWRNGVYSRAGAGATRVSDGDQEQWAWGNGSAAPPTTAFPVPTTVPPPTQPPVTRPASSPGPAPPAAPGDEPTGPAGGGAAQAGSTTSEPGSSTTTGDRTTTSPRAARPGAGDGPGVTGDGPADAMAADRAAATAVATGGADGGDGDDRGGGPLALAGFAAVLATVVGLALRARSARGAGASRN
jgi:hypothetical protein